MTTQTDKIYPALFRAQQKMTAAKKTATNPYFRSKYATLEDVLNACESHLNEEGIMILQPCCTQGVSTTLVHAESGQILECIVPFPASAMADMQKLGGAITYARRYGLESLVALPKEDDDGNDASAKSKTIDVAQLVAQADQLAPDKAKLIKTYINKADGDFEQLKKIQARILIALEGDK